MSRCLTGGGGGEGRGEGVGMKKWEDVDSISPVLYRV